MVLQVVDCTLLILQTVITAELLVALVNLFNVVLYGDGEHMSRCLWHSGCATKVFPCYESNLQSSAFVSIAK